MGVYGKLLNKHYTPPQQQTQSQEPQQSPESQEVGKIGTQEVTKIISQENGKIGEWEDRNLLTYQTTNQGKQESIKRADLPQQTFNMLPEVIALLNATKETLKWKYKIKTTKEQIAEIAIKELCLDVQRNEQDSTLVKELAKILEPQESGKMGKK
jgi:hypothetical protein